MDIIITEKSLRRFLKTKASIEEIITSLCESGPTVDRYRQEGDDTVLEIEVITNRVDAASSFGIAREANAILNQKNIESELLNSPNSITPDLHKNKTQKLNFEITNQKLVKRFSALSIEGVTVKPSPAEISELLTKVSERPINNLVDVTNEGTLLYGSPSHVFDLDKLALQKLIIREAKPEESITLLDNAKITLNPCDIVIEDGRGVLVDLCGVMGGQAAEVDEHTKNVLLIVPIYNPKKIRETSLAHQKRTLAAQIFEKGPDSENTIQILNLLANTITERAGGHIFSQVYDWSEPPANTKKIEFSQKWLTSFLGKEITNEDSISILKHLGFLDTYSDQDSIFTTVPSFRYNDINIKEDLAEEIARIYGFANIPASLPPFTKTPVTTNPIFKLERKIKSILSTEGFNEIYNSSLISKNLIEICLLNPEQHLSLKNSLSEDLQFLRVSLTPSALQNQISNKGKQSQINVFEVANVYLPNKKLPNEVLKLCLSSNQSIFNLKKTLEKLFVLLGYSRTEFLEPKSSSPEFFSTQNTVSIDIGGTKIGHLGEIKRSVSRSLNIDEIISVAEIDLSLLNSLNPTLNYLPISEYPSLKEDITIKSESLIGDIIKKISKISPDIKKIKYKTSYQGKHTFELTIGSDSKNLTQQDSDQIRNKILLSFPT